MDLRAAIASQTAFALRLARSAGAEAGGTGVNIALSPVSLHVVLSLLTVGAKGATLDQIAAVLGAVGGASELAALAQQVVDVVLADGSASGGPRLAAANGVWVDASTPLKSAFKETAVSNYKAEIQTVDFITKADEVVKQVNSWAENITAGLIKELLQATSVNSLTRLVLGNAVYFKGAWSEKFDAAKTIDGEFFPLNGNSIQVPFMTSSSKQFFSAHDGFSVLRLPYKQGEDKRQFSMLIFLPEARDGLWNLADKLNSGQEFLDRHVPAQKVAVGKFLIPKFKISFGFEASSVLKSLGLDLPFSDACDLTEIVDSPVSNALYVSGVFQKCFVEVNEEGTEAAAASGVVIAYRSLPVRYDFVADHPFVFLIKEEKTGVVLFVGYVLNPLA